MNKKNIKQIQLSLVLILVMTGILSVINFNNGTDYQSKQSSAVMPTTSAPEDILWEWNNGDNLQQEVNAVIELSSGDLALGGHTSEYSTGLRDFWIVRIDANGMNPIYYTYENEGDDIAADIVECSDGGFALVGHSKNIAENNWDLMVVRTEPDGSLRWSETYGGASTVEKGHAIVEMSYGFAVLGGTTKNGASNSDFNAWLMKINHEGEILDEDFYGNYGRNDDAFDLVHCEDDGFAMSGYTDIGGGGGYRAWLIRTSECGDLKWEKTYDRINWQWYNSLVQCSDLGFAISGYKECIGAEEDAWLIRTEPDGEERWSKTYELEGVDRARSLVECSDGGFALGGTCGLNSKDFYLVRTEANGDLRYSNNYGADGVEIVRDIALTQDGGFVLVGVSDSFISEGKGRDAWVVKVEGDMDFTPPTWVNLITNHQVNLGSHFEYYLEASDESGIDHYWIDFLYPGWGFNPDTGRIAFTANPSLGSQNLAILVRAYDVYDNYCTEILYIHIRDLSGPRWSIGPNMPWWRDYGIPTNATIEAGGVFSQYICATDNTGISHYWLSNTDDFEVSLYSGSSSEGYLRSKEPLDVGIYNLEVRVYDFYDHYISETITITVQDTTAPVWGTDLPPETVYREVGQSFGWGPIVAEDYSGIDHCWVGDTENFFVYQNSGGFYIQNSRYLEVGEYQIEIRAYDPYDNYCSKIIRLIVQDTTTPFFSDDTIPDVIEISYTRSTQIIGNLKVIDKSEIPIVYLKDQYGHPATGFAFEVFSYPPTGSNHHLHDITIMTTSSLEIGVHVLHLQVYDKYGNYRLKIFRVDVYRQLELKLSGEFDYLKDEAVSIAFTALVSDAETGDLINFADYSDIRVVFTIFNENGEFIDQALAEYIMTGVWRWVNTLTIKEQKDIYTKGVYMVIGRVWIVSGGQINQFILQTIDVIQFHIDPPPDQPSNSWSTLEIFSIGGLIILGCAVAFFFFRERRRSFTLK